MVELALTSLRMALPSLVSTMPPMGSSNILSMDLGPRVVLTISETAYTWGCEGGVEWTYSGGLDVGSLGVLALLSLGVLVQNIYGRS